MPESRITRAFVTSPIIRVRGQKSYTYPDPRLFPGDCDTLKNVNIGPPGPVKRRNGYALFNSAQITETSIAKAVTGLREQKFTNATILKIEVAGTKVYTDDGTTRADVTGTAEVADSANVRYRFEFIDNYIFATGGTTRPWRITSTGNAAVLASSIPFATAAGDYCKDFIVHKNILLALNTKENGTTFPTRVRWCDLNTNTYTIDPTVWPDVNRFEVYDEGAPIVGGADNFGRLLVFKEDGLYPCTLIFNLGIIDFRLIEEESYKGFQPVARNSILSRPEFTWVIAKDGAYIITPAQSGTGLSVNSVTADIQEAWNEDLSPSMMEHAVSWVREKDFQVRTLMASAGSSTLDKVLVYNYRTNQVWFDEYADDMNYAASQRISSAELDFLGSANGYVFTGNTGDTDNGAVINWEADLAPYDMRQSAEDTSQQGKTKDIKHGRIYFREATEAGIVNLTFRLNEGNKASRTTQIDLGSTLKYNTGLAYNSGLEYPGAATRSRSFFINRLAETVGVKLSGSGRVNFSGASFEWVPQEN